MSFLKQLGVTWVSVGATCRRPPTPRASSRSARAMGSGRLQGLQHRQRRGAERQPAQHAGGDAESARPRPEDRRVPELHPLSGQGRIPTPPTPTWATASGRAAGQPAPRGYAARDGDSTSPDWQGQLGRQDIYRAPLARARVHQGRDLGELHLLHQEGGPGGGRGGRSNRHPSGRSAAARAGRRAALHLRQFRRLQEGDRDRQQSRTSASACAVGSWLEGGKIDRARIRWR